MKPTEAIHRNKVIATGLGYSYQTEAVGYYLRKGWWKNKSTWPQRLGWNKGSGVYLGKTAYEMAFDTNWEHLMWAVNLVEQLVDEQGFRPRVTIDTQFIRVDQYELPIRDQGKQLALFTALSDWLETNTGLFTLPDSVHGLGGVCFYQGPPDQSRIVNPFKTGPLATPS